MIIKKINCKTATIMISTIYLPSVLDTVFIKEDMKYDIAITDDWWLSKVTGQSQACYIERLRSTSSKCSPEEIKGVRPLVSLVTENMTQGNKFVLNNYLFTMITNTLALCDTVIGYSDDYLKEATLEKWCDSIKFGSIKFGSFFSVPCVTYEDVVIPAPVFCAPIFGNGIESFLLRTGYDYWTQHRLSEFTCAYVNSHGYLTEGDNCEKHHICPIMSVDLSEFNVGDRFEFDHRLYRVINGQIALCLNTIGTSYYSSGIAEIGDEDEEEEFYEASEAFEFIKKWIDLNFDYWNQKHKIC